MASDAGSEKNAPPSSERDDGAVASAHAPPSEWPDVPGFEIEGELGRGGMGVVYKAFQPDRRRFVALKLIRDGALASPQQQARMRIEAEAISRLEHPGIVRIFEVGEHRGQPFLAMEFVQGPSLDRRLKIGTLSPRAAAQLVRDLALAIQHVHDREIVHRDLKPANVLLRDVVAPTAFDAETRDAESAADLAEAPLVPLIVDFGLAKRLDSDSAGWTQAGAVLGTASYLAPEQLLEGASAAGRAADIYALGTILYEALAGRPPFRADDWNATLAQVLRDDPPPLRRWGTKAPESLEAVCLRCLEKDPARRYLAGSELAEDLDRFLAGRTVHAAPTNQRDRIARRAAREDCAIVEEIGRGPRSVVYRALLGPMRQGVALKVFDEGACGEAGWTERLERVSRLSAVVNHPQAVLPRQAGRWDATPYLISEYVPQGSVAASIAERRFSIRAALRLTEQIAEVVCYLHRQGTTHGNLKPSNVLFAADGIPRVVDFHPVGGERMNAETHDPPFDAGTAYLPPELFVGAEREPRPYTDIYSLGAILYGAITGRAPFVAEDREELLERMRSERPAPLAQAENDVSPRVESICLRALRKQPWHRYRRAYDFLRCVREALEEFDGDAPHARDRRR